MIIQMFCITLHNDYANWGTGNTVVLSHWRSVWGLCKTRLQFMQLYVFYMKQLCKKLYLCCKCDICPAQPARLWPGAAATLGSPRCSKACIECWSKGRRAWRPAAGGGYNNGGATRYTLLQLLRRTGDVVGLISRDWPELGLVGVESMHNLLSRAHSPVQRGTQDKHCWLGQRH